jgi:ribonuclease Z
MAKSFQLTLLGTSAAVPYKNRYLAGQVLMVGNQSFLIDCGEATQFRFKDWGIKTSKIEQIFISHLHGDHCFGIFGVLTSMAMMGREHPLSIYTPKGLEEMVTAVFKATYYSSPFPIHFFEIEPTGLTTQNAPIFENKNLTVHAVPLNHRIPTVGYVFREKPSLRNIRPEKIAELNLSFDDIRAVKSGADFTNTEGVVFPNAELTIDPTPPRSFAYCSDTAFEPSIAPFIKSVDLLYHEATFMQNMAEHAQKVGHSTAEEAAQIAKMAGVGRLIIGHYSSRYDDLLPLLAEAKNVFENTVLGIDGEMYSV